MALLEIPDLSGDALHEWFRERQLFAHHLTSWQAAFFTQTKSDSGIQEIFAFKDEQEQPKRDLVSKEKDPNGGYSLTDLTEPRSHGATEPRILIGYRNENF